MLACGKRHEACMQALLQADADPSMSNADGNTALMAACQNGHAACVQTLLKAGADPKLLTPTGIRHRCWHVRTATRHALRCF